MARLDRTKIENFERCHDLPLMKGESKKRIMLARETRVRLLTEVVRRKSELAVAGVYASIVKSDDRVAEQIRILEQVEQQVMTITDAEMMDAYREIAWPRLRRQLGRLPE